MEPATNSNPPFDPELSALVKLGGPYARLRYDGEEVPTCEVCRAAPIHGVMIDEAKPEVPGLAEVRNAMGEIIVPAIPTRPAVPAVFVHYTLTCGPCGDKLAEALHEKESADSATNIRADRLKWYAEMWNGGPDAPPSIYLDTDFARLPNHPAARKVLAWEPWADDEKPGLLIIGDTGGGKTRSVFLLLRELLLKYNVRAKVHRCVKLRHTIAAAARSSDPEAREKLMQKIYRAPVVFLDDLGQMNASPAAMEALYELIEELTSRRIPIIATTQFSGERLTAVFKDKPETGAAITRRLQDFCRIVEF